MAEWVSTDPPLPLPCSVKVRRYNGLHCQRSLSIICQLLLTMSDCVVEGWYGAVVFDSLNTRFSGTAEVQKLIYVLELTVVWYDHNPGLSCMRG